MASEQSAREHSMASTRREQGDAMARTWISLPKVANLSSTSLAKKPKKYGIPLRLPTSPKQPFFYFKMNTEEGELSKEFSVNGPLTSKTVETVEDLPPLQLGQLHDEMRKLQETIAKAVLNERPAIQKHTRHFLALTETITSRVYDKALLQPDVYLEVYRWFADITLGFERGLHFMREEISREVALTLASREETAQLRVELEKLRAERNKLLMMKDRPQHTQCETKLSSAVQREGEWSLEKGKLLAQIEALTKQIEDYQANSTVGRLKVELERSKAASAELVAKLESSFDDRGVRLAKNDLTISNLRMSMERLETELTESRSISATLGKELDFVRKQLNSRSQDFSMYRESVMMASEEVEAYRLQYKRTIVYLESVKEKLATSQQRLMEHSKNQGGQVQDDRSYTAETFVMNSVRAVLKEATYLHIKRQHSAATLQQQKSILTRQGTTVDLTVIAMEGEAETDAAASQQLELLTLYKPTFFSYVESRYNEYMMIYEADGTFAKLRATEIMSIMRGLLDAKWTEFQLAEPALPASPWPAISGFVEFVYAWTSRFTVNVKQMQITELTTVERIDTHERQLQLLLFLQNTKANKLWEVVTFREFLEESAPLDELCFYLHCRWLLFRGRHLDHLQAYTLLINLVTVAQASEVIKVVLRKFDESIIEKVRLRIRERLIRKGSRELVDAGFVLRVLLEFYRRERLEKFKILRAIFRESTGNSNSRKGISFEMFRSSFLKAYEDMSPIEIGTLYRNAWNIGNGMISFDTAWIAAQESGFFLRQLKLTHFHYKPGATRSFDIFLEEGSEVYEMYYLISDEFESLKAFAVNSGMETVFSALKQAEIWITQKFTNCDPADLQGRTPLQFYLMIINLALKVRHIEYGKESLRGNKTLRDGLSASIKALTGVLSNITDYEAAQTIRKKVNDAKFSKLQHFLRAKVSKWGNVVYDLIKLKSIHSRVHRNRALSKGKKT